MVSGSKREAGIQSSRGHLVKGLAGLSGQQGQGKGDFKIDRMIQTPLAVWHKLSLVLVCWLAMCGAVAAADFDSHGPGYVLALSWSPSFCASSAGEREPDQCGSRRYGFVVHGLWSHSPKKDCRPPGQIDADIVRDMLPIMPSRRLIDHEWAKHGTCDSPTPRAYFAKTKKAFATIVIPETLKSPSQPVRLTAKALRDAFVAANPTLPGNGISVSCRGRYVSDVRVCLTTDLGFASCPVSRRERCQGELVLRPLR